MVNKEKKGFYCPKEMSKANGNYVENISIQILRCCSSFVDIMFCVWTRMRNKILFLELDNPQRGQTENIIFFKQ